MTTQNETTRIAVGKTVPNFSLPATSDQKISLKDLKGQHVILYFYPKDSTPGCTLESQDFRDQSTKFGKENAVILGVSRDSLSSHEKFKSNEKLPFELLSDDDEELCELFDVIKMKNMYGKQVRGVERSTFIIDKNGVLVHEWRGVKVDGHALEVLNFIKAI